MHELGTLDCFRIHMQNGNDQWRMPTFEDLWRLDELDQLLSRLPEGHEINRCLAFYIILYRNRRGDKGLYVGRSINVRRRLHEHMTTINVFSDTSTHYRTARNIMKEHGGELRFIPISFVHENETMQRTSAPWIEQLFIMLFESYNARLFGGLGPTEYGG